MAGRYGWLLVIIFYLFGFILPKFNLVFAGATYYVSMSGDNTNCTGLSPNAYSGSGTGQACAWKTIQKGVDAMAGGDTVYVRGGTYNQAVKFVYKTNTTGQYMTLSAYPGEKVIIDGTNIAFSYDQEGLIYVKRSDNVRITGFYVQNVNMTGIYASYSSNITVDHNFTDLTARSGVGFYGIANGIVDGNDIQHMCGVFENNLFLSGCSEENISISATSSNVEVKNNTVHDPGAIPYGYAGAEGINIKDGCNNITVHHNLVYNMHNRLAYGVDAWNNSNVTHDIIFYDNIARDSAYGFIVSSEQGTALNNIKLYNNIAYNNLNAGFSIVWWSGTADAMKTNVYFYNNTSYKNGIGFSIQSPKNQNVVVKNNIFSQNTTSISLVPEAVSQTTIDKNIFYGTGGTYGTNPVTGDPKFANASAGDFHLLSGSSAIDAGLSAIDISVNPVVYAPNVDYDGNSRPRGAGFDIGAYEYTGISVTSTPTTIPKATPTPLSGMAAPTLNCSVSGSATINFASQTGAINYWVQVWNTDNSSQWFYNSWTGNTSNSLTITGIPPGTKLTAKVAWTNDINYINVSPFSNTGNTVCPVPTATPSTTTPSVTPRPTVTPSPGPIVSPTPISGRVYYVSTTGSDTNSGTINQPWKTITKAANTMSAGDTVYIRGGTYPEQVIPQKSGNATAGYITYAAYPGETPVIDGASLNLNTWDGLFWLNTYFVPSPSGSIKITRSYIKISGLKIINAHGNADGYGGYDITGIRVDEADHVIVEKNSTYNTRSSGIGIWGSTNVVVDGNNIGLACNCEDTTRPCNTTDNIPGSEEDLTVASSAFVEVKNNYLYDAATIESGHSGGEGINIKVDSHDISVHHNTVNLARVDGKQATRLAYGVDAWSGDSYNIRIYNNIAYNCGHAFIVETEREGTARDIYVYNNLAYNNVGSGFYIPNWNSYPSSPGWVKNVYFVNNTSYNNSTGIMFNYVNIQNITVRNNIFYNNANGAVFVDSGVPANQIIQDHNFTADPKFVNPSLLDFHLQSISGAINAGVDVSALGITNDFDGIDRSKYLPYDIGAYEYVSSVVPSPTPVSKPGDADGNQIVNMADMIRWLNGYVRNLTGVSNGDFDGSGGVNGKDYQIWMNNYGK
jgi:hypothetical protein